MFTKKLEKCCNGGNQHNFKPRYTEENTNIRLSEFSGLGGTDQLRRLLVREVYIGDVCEWCGKTVKFGD